MRIIGLAITFCLLSSAAVAGVRTSSSVGPDMSKCLSGNLTYIPLPAMPVGGYTEFQTNADGSLGAPRTVQWPSGAEPRNKLLTNISSAVGGDETSASSNAPVFAFSNQRKKYTIDFMKWRGEQLVNAGGSEIGWGRVGVGMRVVINVTRSDGSASGSLFALALSAKAGKTQGTITTELIGIDAPEVTAAMPFTVDLSDGNIQKIIEALTIVKSKLYGEKTTVEPHLIAQLVCSPIESKTPKRR